MAVVDIDQLGYHEIMPRVGELADELLNHPDEEVREQIEELLDWVDIFHREGLNRVVGIIRAWRGDLFLAEAEKDEIMGPFLVAYDLAEDPFIPEAPEDDQPSSDEPAADGDFS